MQEMRQHVTYDSQSAEHLPRSLDGTTGSGLTPVTRLSGQSSADMPPSMLVTAVTRKRTPLVSLAAAGLVSLFLLAGAGVGLYFLIPRSTDVTISEKSTGKFDDEHRTNSTPAPDNFILVEGGVFMMGRSDIGNPTDTVWGPQYPAHRVTVGKFYVAPTETTVAEYAECVKAAKCTAPSDWRDGEPPEGKDNYPVVNISFADAKGYAVWFSQREKKVCRLPEEKEWEYAARNGAVLPTFRGAMNGDRMMPFFRVKRLRSAPQKM